MQRCVDAICTSLAQQLSEAGDELSLTLRRRTASRLGSVTLSFPGNTPEDAWRFTVVLRILHIIREALAADVILTKRDIYYRDPALFGSQAVVDRYVEDIALTFDVPRSLLNVTAAAKGLIFGSLQIQLTNGAVIDASTDRDGILVPDDRNIAALDAAQVHWILVVEKEATFKSMTSAAGTNLLLEGGLIVTAKGYPDISTRQLLRRAWNAQMYTPIYALVDFDPDGLSIYSNYKYGPTYATSETDVALPSIQVLGVTSDQLRITAERSPDRGLLPLTTRDRKKATNMLRKDAAVQELQMRLELQRMLVLNLKAELQHVDTDHGVLLGMLNKQLHMSMPYEG